MNACKQFNTKVPHPGFTISINQKKKKKKKSVCDKRIRFSHMKRGAAQRDLTSAFMCAFGLVSGTKTWPAKPMRLSSIGTRVTITTKLTMHMQASAC